MLTCVILFFHILLFMILPFDSIMDSKCKCKHDSEAKKSCKIMTLDEKLKILDKLCGSMNAAAVGLTFRLYFILKS
jgi:hypothetical protein